MVCPKGQQLARHRIGNWFRVRIYAPLLHPLVNVRTEMYEYSVQTDTHATSYLHHHGNRTRNEGSLERALHGDVRVFFLLWQRTVSCTLTTPPKGAKGAVGSFWVLLEHVCVCVFLFGGNSLM